MNIETYKLTDSALDWAVAKCEGKWILDVKSFTPNHELGRMCFSTDWSQGDPIIERERITVNIGWTTEKPLASIWTVKNGEGFASFKCRGETPLIAAMRTYVRSKLGDHVEVPDELCK